MESDIRSDDPSGLFDDDACTGAGSGIGTVTVERSVGAGATGRSVGGAQKTEKARRAYREQHESEFIISESAARYFKAQGITKLPASKTLQTEIEQLTKEKNALYNEYREKKANVRELQTVKSNLDKILRREPERGKGRENER